MNSAPTPTAPPNRDLFFRLADRLQLDACVQAVAEEGKSLVLHSVNAGMLEHYGQLLVQRLRQRLPDTPTEIFFPTHTEALIETFNAMLEHVSVDDATQAGGPSAPSKLWVVHDASALPDHELKLMARLLQHLPGARVSAVLMLHGQAEVLRNLDPQGRRLMRWDIEPPSQEQIDQLVQEARQQGREFATLELVARLGAPAPSPAPAAKPTAAAAATASAPANADAAVPTAAAPSRLRRLTPLLAAATGLLLLSVGVAAWLHPDAMRQLMPQSQTAAAVAPVSAASEAPQATAPAASDTPAPSAPATTDASAPPASEAQVSAAPVALAAPTAPASAAPAAAAPAPATKAPEPAPASAKNWVTELPEPAVRGLGWLRQLDKDTWVIEHGRHASIQAARKQLGADKLLANARIVPVVRQGAETAEFLLITGPFRSQDRARNFSARNELPASTKVHATSTLLAMTPSGNETARP